MTGIDPQRLHWPAGQPRTPIGRRRSAAFRHQGGIVPMNVAMQRLAGELQRLGAKDAVLSSDLPRNLDGSIAARAPAGIDPAIAVHFKLFGKPTVLACDRWDRPADNIAAIAAHIEALRGMDRWGVGTLEQAFAGYQALPAPEQWWQILGVGMQATRAEIEIAYRAKARDAHPDAGGSDAAMARLNAARDAALQNPTAKATSQ